ncbi:MAG: putative toxin-antitoxin system toxin component, PIN family, partial [Spirochaetales bacterium]|nr:putative toxin-antitoxin system toxin component, PIN family [Spirochaetales bacterium]
MFSVVIDTNVLVSALIIPGSVPEQVLSMVKNRLLPTRYNTAILAEYWSVLSRPKFNFRGEDIQRAVNGIFKAGICVEVISSSFPLPDEDDRKFYDVAKITDSMLITGNMKHFP